MQSIKTRAALAALLIPLALTAAGCSAETEDAPPAAEPVAEETRAPLKLAGQYRAFLYEPDHQAATGGRHTEAWQVLREDRVNFHARDVSQADDQTDPVFGEAANRERIEAMVANGNLTEQSARKIVERNVLVAVDIYTRDGEPERLDVSVY
ncbi:hypothetical protein AAG596_02835 [Citromicrobium bathyomarinum]|uniref:hypothetical protein n=1 Tax=Citromicrobium bathyomarinum TaxID=72174 RepID=UPI00315A3815